MFSKKWALLSASCAFGFWAGPAFADCTGGPVNLPNGTPYIANPYSPEFQAYLACKRAEREAIVLDPSHAFVLRQRTDERTAALKWISKEYLDREGFSKLGRFLDFYLQASTEYSVEVKQGIRQKYDALAAQFQAYRAAPTLDPAQARNFISSWDALRLELLNLRNGRSTEDEKQLIDAKISSGDILVQAITLEALLKLERTDPIAAKQILEQLQANGRLLKNIDASLVAMVATASRDPFAPAPGEPSLTLEEKLRVISEYAVVGNALVDLSARLGMVNARDAETAHRVVTGVSQLSSAITMIAAGGATAGPYGMAVGAALSLISAFDRQGPSAAQQTMKMLRALSRQIADLQYTVEQRFDQLSAQISETEMRIMGKFARVLQSDATILATLDDVRNDIRALRLEFIRARTEDRLSAINAFYRDIVYDDATCLTPIGRRDGEVLDKCLENYERLLRSLDTIHNAQLGSDPIASPGGPSGHEERVRLLFQEINRIKPGTLAGEPTHRPTLALLAERIRTFVASNPRIANRARVRQMLGDVARKEAANAAFVGAITDPDFVAGLQKDYDASLTAVLVALDQRREIYRVGLAISDDQSFHQEQVQIANEDGSLAKVASRYARSPASGRIFEQYELGNDPSFSPSSPTLEGLIRSFSDIAMAEPRMEGPLAGELSGYTWVRPCNAESGYPSVPVDTVAVAKSLPAELMRLNRVTQDAVSICYAPSLRQSNDEVSGIANTNATVPQVLQRIARKLDWKSQRYGGPLGSFLSSPYMESCRRLPDHLRQVYGRHPEYARSDWEKCHNGHYHYVLTARTNHMLGTTVQVSVNLAGFRSPQKTLNATVNYPNGSLDKCFMPFDRSGSGNKLGILAPYLQQTPLPIDTACASLPANIRSAIEKLAPELNRFVDTTTTRPVAATGGDISFRKAAALLSETQRDRNYAGFISRMFEPLDSGKKLDYSAEMLRASLYFSGSGDRDAPPPMTYSDLGDFFYYRLRTLEDPSEGQKPGIARFVDSDPRKGEAQTGLAKGI